MLTGGPGADEEAGAASGLTSRLIDALADGVRLDTVEAEREEERFAQLLSGSAKRMKRPERVDPTLHGTPSDTDAAALNETATSADAGAASPQVLAYFRSKDGQLVCEERS